MALKNAVAPIAPVGSAGAFGALAGVACCGPFLVQWLAQGVLAAGGVAALVFLVRYEVPILLGVAAAGWLCWRLSADQPTRQTNAALAVVALVFALIRLSWDLSQSAIMAVPALYWPFVYRQAIFAVLAALVLGLQLARTFRWVGGGLGTRKLGARRSACGRTASTLG